MLLFTGIFGLSPVLAALKSHVFLIELSFIPSIKKVNLGLINSFSYLISVLLFIFYFFSFYLIFCIEEKVKKNFFLDQFFDWVINFKIVAFMHSSLCNPVLRYLVLGFSISCNQSKKSF